MEGLVTKSTGARYEVLPAEGGAPMQCLVKGNFRIRGIRTTNPVAVGDRVTVTPTAEAGTGFITAIAPRSNYIIRRASNLSKEAHILAANIDRVALTVTLAHPQTSLTFIDRLLATAEAYGVEAMLVINKVDLLVSDDDRALLEAVAYLYRSVGYPVIELSAKTGQGLPELKEALKGRVTLLSGNSGVGKSTIINDLLPLARQKTAEISDVHDTGMHTTTFSEMFFLPEGGAVIDTPGVKGFGTIDFEKAEVGHYFPEIFRAGRDCRYGDCTHTHEPGCNVLRLLANHEIAQSRYSSYLSILEDSADDKYRKPF